MNIDNLSTSEKLALLSQLADSIYLNLKQGYEANPQAVGRGGLPDYLIAAQIKANAEHLLKWHGKEVSK